MGLGNLENVSDFFFEKADFQKSAITKLQEDIIDEVPFSDLVVWNWAQTSS